MAADLAVGSRLLALGSWLLADGNFSGLRLLRLSDIVGFGALAAHLLSFSYIEYAVVRDGLFALWRLAGTLALAGAEG